jgi:hypothetical protein
MAMGTKESMIQGKRRPHLVWVLSDKKPINVSFKLFQIDQIINPRVIQPISNPTTAK